MHPCAKQRITTQTYSKATADAAAETADTNTDTDYSRGSYTNHLSNIHRAWCRPKRIKSSIKFIKQLFRSDNYSTMRVRSAQAVTAYKVDTADASVSLPAKWEPCTASVRTHRVGSYGLSSNTLTNRTCRPPIKHALADK